VGNKKLFDDEVEHYGGPATDTESSSTSSTALKTVRGRKSERYSTSGTHTTLTPAETSAQDSSSTTIDNTPPLGGSCTPTPYFDA
jgi:hypothetical protein